MIRAISTVGLRPGSRGAYPLFSMGEIVHPRACAAQPCSRQCRSSTTRAFRGRALHQGRSAVRQGDIPVAHQARQQEKVTDTLLPTNSRLRMHVSATRHGAFTPQQGSRRRTHTGDLTPAHTPRPPTPLPALPITVMLRKRHHRLRSDIATQNHSNNLSHCFPLHYPATRSNST